MNTPDPIADFPGGSGGAAMTARRLHDLVRSAVEAGQALVTLPEGEHRVSGDLLPDKFLWISNNDSGIKQVLLDVSGASDLVIDGSGCRLLIEGAVIPVLMSGCRNVTLRNLTIDWVRPGFTEIAVAASGPGFVEFEGGGELGVDRGRLIALGGGLWPSGHLYNLIAFDRVRREPLVGTGENWNLERAHRATALGGGRFRMDADLDAPPPAGGAAVLMHGDRVAPAAVIDRSEGVTLEDVVIHHALGMGIIAQVSKDITWRRVRVVPSGRRLFSTWVDATHAVDCSGFLRMEECELRGMFDDGTNIHGVYHRSAGWRDPRRLRIETVHQQQWGISFLRPGDKVRLCDPDSLSAFSEAVVREVSPVNARFHDIAFDAPPAGAGRECVVHRYDPFFRVEILRTTISQHRGRGLLLSVPGKIRVRGNLLHSSGLGVHVGPDASYWWESGPVEDLLIEDNLFDACGYAMCGDRVVGVAAPPGTGALHGKVVFRNNEVRAAGPVLVEAHRVESLCIEGNRISRHAGYPWTDPWAPLQAVGCHDVHHDLPERLAPSDHPPQTS